MSNHDCPFLEECFDHPKWRTVQLGDGRTRVLPPGPLPKAFYGRVDFVTHSNAIAYATEQARAQQVTAVQDGAR